MGLLDSLKNVLSGSGKSPQPIVLEPGEREIARTSGCTLKDGVSWVGGDLALTDRRLLFTPMNVGDIAALLQYGLKQAGAPSSAATVVGWMAKQAQQIPTGLTSMAGVAAGRQAGLTHPAAMVVQLADGRTLEFGVLKSRRTSTGSSANNAARDGFVALVNAEL